MAETINIGEIANKLSKDIFRHFHWKTHPLWEQNIDCTNENHLGDGGAAKISHPADVVFYYDDPYLGHPVYLHTDLKSYKKKSIIPSKIREALKSLCMTIECVKGSDQWRKKYSVPASESYEVRGLLFIHNHDHTHTKSFEESINKIDLSNLPVPLNSYIHYLGPSDIQRLYSIGNDLLRMKAMDELPTEYTFYYPDLVMIRRQGDVWGQAATIESLTSPFLIIKHDKTDIVKAGYVIYYNRDCSKAEEFEYFFDCLSRFQLLESDETIRVRVTYPSPDEDMKSNFHTAKKKYVKSWGFDKKREDILNQIQIDTVTAVTDNYTPGDMGWRL